MQKVRCFLILVQISFALVGLEESPIEVGAKVEVRPEIFVVDHPKVDLDSGMVDLVKKGTHGAKESGSQQICGSQCRAKLHAINPTASL